MDYDNYVSVIIPVYNAEKYIRKCLDSLVHQTLREIEIICVNDGSTDGSLDILQEYEKQDTRIKVLSQLNTGVSAARNKGMGEATGQFIAFLDADDYLEPETYEKAFNAALDRKADIVVFGGAAFPFTSWANDKLNTRDACYSDGIEALFKENGSRPFCFNKIYSRELCLGKSFQFDEELSLGEDLELMFKIFPLAGTIAFLSDKMYHYRQHDRSAMAFFSSNLDDKVNKHFRIIRKITERWKEQGYTQQYGNEYAQWLIDFMYDDISKCRYNFKKKACKELAEIIEATASIECLQDDYIRKYSLTKQLAEESYVYPKVTVIMPVYNASEYLYDTLQCLSFQTRQDFEIIFVDDGSDDDSLKILSKFAEDDMRVKVLTQHHCFAGSARNKGIDSAIGEYLLFLDSDDFFAPDMICKAVEEADLTGSDICVFGADSINNVTRKRNPTPWLCNKKYIPQNSKVFSRKSNAKYIFCFTTAVPWNKLFRRSFVEQYNLRFQDTRSANDVAFIMTGLALAESISTVEDVLLTYRVNNTSSLQGSQDKKPESFYQALLELRRRLKEKGIYQEVEPAFINFALDCCIYNLKSMKTYEGFEKTYNLLKNTTFEELDLLRWPKAYLYGYPSNKIYENREDILKLSIPEYLHKYGIHFGDVDQPRLGMLYKQVLWFPLKIRGGVKCLKDNGVRYTINRLKEKLSERF